MARAGVLTCAAAVACWTGSASPTVTSTSSGTPRPPSSYAGCSTVGAASRPWSGLTATTWSSPPTTSCEPGLPPRIGARPSSAGAIVRIEEPGVAPRPRSWRRRAGCAGCAGQVSTGGDVDSAVAGPRRPTAAGQPVGQLVSAHPGRRPRSGCGRRDARTRSGCRRRPGHLPALTDGFSAAFLGAGIIAASGALLAALTLRGPRPQAPGIAETAPARQGDAEHAGGR